MSRSMNEFFKDKEVDQLNARLYQAHRVIWELIGALDCQNDSLRELSRDVAIEYMKAVNFNAHNIKSI
jgi:hypothetical protein